jgi:hypothetical protein
VINDTKIGIVKLFSRDFSRELTIRQVSKLIGKSYGFINKETRELIGSGVLNKKIIGASILCSLNLKSDLTLALLVTHSVLEKEDYLRQKPVLSGLLRGFSSHVAERSLVFSIVLSEKRITVICDNELATEDAVKQYSPEGYEVRIIEGANFTPQLINMEKSVVVYGFESFWRMMNVG